MNRRELLKRAALVPAAALGTVLASSAPAEAALFGTIVYVKVGGFGPESFNGGDIVFTINDGDNIYSTALVDKKTKIFITGQKVRHRTLLETAYVQQEVLNAQLHGAQIIVTYRDGLKAKKVDINYPLPQS